MKNKLIKAGTALILLVITVLTILLLLPLGGVTEPVEPVPANISLIGESISNLDSELNNSLRDFNESMRDYLRARFIESLSQGRGAQEFRDFLNNDSLIIVGNESPFQEDNDSLIQLGNDSFIIRGNDSLIIVGNDSPVINLYEDLSSNVEGLNPELYYFDTSSSRVIDEFLSVEAKVVPCNEWGERHYYGADAISMMGLEGTPESAYARVMLCLDNRNYTFGLAITNNSLSIPFCLEQENRVINQYLFRNCVEDDEVKAVAFNASHYFTLTLNGFNTSPYVGFTEVFFEQFI